jgi:predicted PurR-regulated permease PerM
MMFLAALVARELFHQLSSFLLLVLVSIFLAFAIEPGVNRLAKRGWRRGSGTLLIIFGVIAFIGGFLGAVGTLVGSQVADVLENSEMYVNFTVSKRSWCFVATAHHCVVYVLLRCRWSTTEASDLQSIARG